MTTTQKTTQDYAKEALTYFERITRSNDSEAYTTKPETPEWLTDLIRTAHGDLMPDDWKYEFIHDALLHFEDNDFDDEDLPEAIDSCVSIYNHELLKWVSSNLNRSSYVDDAVNEWMGDKHFDLYEALAAGQYKEIEEVFHSVGDSLKELTVSE